MVKTDHPADLAEMSLPLSCESQLSCGAHKLGLVVEIAWEGSVYVKCVLRLSTKFGG